MTQTPTRRQIDDAVLAQLEATTAIPFRARAVYDVPSGPIDWTKRVEPLPIDHVTLTVSELVFIARPELLGEAHAPETSAPALAAHPDRAQRALDVLHSVGEHLPGVLRELTRLVEHLAAPAPGLRPASPYQGRPIATFPCPTPSCPHVVEAERGGINGHSVVLHGLCPSCGEVRVER